MEIEDINNIPNNSLEREVSAQELESQVDEEEVLEKLVAELSQLKKQETQLYYGLIDKESGYLKIEKNIKLFQKELRMLPDVDTEKIDF